MNNFVLNNYYINLNNFYINYLDNNFNLISDVSNFSLYHYSIPNVKLYYPEPFIASPTFMHDDIWFIHIVIYQYWLWFFFIFLIIFFFISFLVALRWCNVRFKPVRETRGVSRSKCGDLITATVPVSWATSIIIHESTDAIEFADGFGTTEVAVGIRAYQWGWEYYYPRDLDLNYFYNDSSFFFGNSLFYKFNQENNSNLLKWKLNILDNSTSSVSNYSYFMSNKSLFNKNYLFFNNYFLFNTNKLLNSYSSNLITSMKLHYFFDNLYSSFFFKKNKFFSTYNSLYKYSFNSLLIQKPYFNNYKYNFLNNLSIFNYSFNLSNFKLLLNSNWNNQLIFSNFNILNFFFNFNNLFIEQYAFNKNLNFIKESLQTTNNFFSKNTIHFNNFLILNSSNWLINSFIANQDFKRWASNDLFEDFYFSFFNNDEFLVNSFKLKKLNYFDSTISIYKLLNYFQKQQLFSSLIFKDSITTNFLHTINLNIEIYPLLNFSDLKNLNFWFSFLNNSWNLLQWNLNSLHKYSTSNIIFNFSLFFRSISVFEFLLNYDAVEYKTALNLFSIFNYNYSSDFFKIDFLSINKNFNVFNQAFTKVFKSSIEEQRLSNLFNLLSKSYNDLLFVSSTPTTLLSNLQKNNIFFINTILYKPFILSLHTNSLNLNKIFDFFILKFPFLSSIESDIIRYSWFDWYSVRNTISTKALDTSVFDLHGAKYYSFSFSNNNTISFLNQTDNFFNKYVQARKLYIPLFIYTPFFFNKFLFNYTYLLLNDLNLFSSFNSLNSFFSYLFYFEDTYIYINLLNYYSIFNNSSSNSTSYIEFTHTSLNNSWSKFNTISRLADILTKREYIYKKYLLNFNNSLNFIYLNNYILSDLNPILFFFKSYDNINNIYSYNNIFNYKMQYTPLRKGITNMIRIQADKAIALPTEVRIQILAVSKDIIHSWSIPSAGVKIDCIPGYSSHKVMIFLLSGIYWGQCMEICGRFHHWMPIVVYFMKRDLFCIWCLHFIFKKKQNNFGTQNLINYDKEFFTKLFNNTSLWFYNL